MKAHQNKKRAAVLVLMFIFVFTSFAPALAQSLWVEQSAGMFSDRRAHQVGDVVTILISENSSAVRSGSSTNSKSSEVKLGVGLGLLSFIKDAGANQSDKFNAQGAITNINKVSGKLTTTVKEVLPNGTLLISGTQKIKQNDEDQTIMVSGVIRPEDIGFDNTILSSQVADAEIQITGKGPIMKKQRKGILSQILNFLF